MVIFYNCFVLCIKIPPIVSFITIGGINISLTVIKLKIEHLGKNWIKYLLGSMALNL